MNLYLVARPPSHKIDYDEYSRFVVCCADERTARTTHPTKHGYRGMKPTWVEGRGWTTRENRMGDAGMSEIDEYHSWTTDLDSLEVALLGPAEDNVPSNTVICSSYHAG